MKFLRIFFLLLFTLIIWLSVRQYFFCPQFSFVKGKPFTGSQVYNPYGCIDSGDWVKCNFHAHTHAWGGLSNGHGTAADVWRCYDSLGYGVHSVSNYHKINDEFSDRDNYVPAYEHGYNYKKTHHLVLGDREVTWLDYMFPQTLSNKQNILNKLSASGNNAVILNHPSVGNGFTEDDMNYLSNYNCIEVLNPWGFSFAHWDAALSAGKPVFIIGDDDAHDVCRPFSIGQCFTGVNVQSLNCKNILDGIKRGQSYGMHVANIAGETMAERIQRFKYEMPALKKLCVIKDTIELTITKPAKEIQFIGQNGKILQTADSGYKASYVMQQQDTYVRTAITFSDGTKMFLNPVFRYSISPLAEKGGPVLNTGKTLLMFFAGMLILSAWLLFVINSLFGKLLRKTPGAQQPLPENPYPALG